MTKVTVSLSEEDLATLKALAEQRQSTLVQALRQAIATERIIQEEVRQGGKLLIERSGRLKEIVFR